MFSMTRSHSRSNNWERPYKATTRSPLRHSSDKHTPNSHLWASSSSRTARCFCPLICSISARKNRLLATPISQTDPNWLQSSASKSVKSSIVPGLRSEKDHSNNNGNINLGRAEVESHGTLNEWYLLACSLAALMVLAIDRVRTRKAFRMPRTHALFTSLTWRQRMGVV